MGVCSWTISSTGLYCDATRRVGVHAGPIEAGPIGIAPKSDWGGMGVFSKILQGLCILHSGRGVFAQMLLRLGLCTT